LDTRALSTGAGVLLVGWAVYHWRWGHRHRVRIGMQTGLLGLALWSFLMATAHGAGLMLWPVLMPLVSVWAYTYDGVYLAATRTATVKCGA
jgi:hypothetical protein